MLIRTSKLLDSGILRCNDALFPADVVKQERLPVRGKKFKCNHVHSIVKKKRQKDEKLKREYPEKWSDFSLEVVDKTLVNMFDNFLE